MTTKLRPVTVLQYEHSSRGNVFRCKGHFHAWGVDYEEFETGAGNFSTAIVELENGEVINERADLIRFDDVEVK